MSKEIVFLEEYMPMISGRVFEIRDSYINSIYITCDCKSIHDFWYICSLKYLLRQTWLWPTVELLWRQPRFGIWNPVDGHLRGCSEMPRPCSCGPWPLGAGGCRSLTGSGTHQSGPIFGIRLPPGSICLWDSAPCASEKPGGVTMKHEAVQGGAWHVWAYDPVQLLWFQVEGRI